MRVAICVPSGDHVHTDFAISLAGLVRAAQVEKLGLFNERGSVLPESRNRLVRSALAAGANWLLWLDSDMAFPPNTLDRLLAHSDPHTMNVPIVGARYVRREAPHDLLGVPSVANAERPGLTTMASMPFGCMLVSAHIFNILPPPWFRFEYDGQRPIGEDVGFCRRAIAAGYPVQCDDALTLELGHIGRAVHRVPVPAAALEAA